MTLPGPLWPPAGLALADVTPDTLAKWHESEALRGKHQAARALMMSGLLALVRRPP